MLRARASDITPELTLQALCSCLGREKAVSGPDLVELITGKKVAPAAARELRRVISVLREKGWPVCGRPEDGYYLATSVQELEDTRQLLYERAMCSLKVRSWLNRIIPRLVGQLSLPIGDPMLPALPEPITGSVEPLAIELPSERWQVIKDWLEQHPGCTPSWLVNEALVRFLQDQEVKC